MPQANAPKTNTLKQYFAIQKVDEDQRMVWGYASTEMTDSQGEIVTKAAMSEAWSDYMQFANVREMHKASAVGVVKEYNLDDPQGIMIGAKIVDDAAWEKVKEGVYKGFSIGGSKIPGGYDASTNTINGLKLTEISLVDRPSNPGALITMFKVDNIEDTVMPKSTSTNPVAAATPPAQVETEVAPVAKAEETAPVAAPEVVAPVVAETPAEPVVHVVSTEPVVAKSGLEELSELISKGQATPEQLVALFKSAQNSPQITDTTGASTLSKVNAPEKIVAKCVLQQSIAAISGFSAIAKGDSVNDVIQKGLSSVGWFANLINELQWLQESCAYEAEREGDRSPLPAKIAAATQLLGGLLVEMCTEEVAEMVAGMNIDPLADPLAALTLIIENADTTGTLQKMCDATAVLKAGARNSTADKERLQKAHDLLSEMGADCSADETQKLHTHTHDVLQKVEGAGQIAKALNTVEGLAATVAKLQKGVTDLQDENKILKAQIDKTPTVPKGVSRVVSKGDDVTPEEGTQAEIEAVYKSDGTIDEAATAIKKVHAGGGRTLTLAR